MPSHRALVSAFAFLAAFASAPSIAEEGRAATAPRVRLIHATGELEVGGDRSQDVPGQNLPMIPSGSIIRVLSGEAAFESDYHLTIRARKGNAFIVNSYAPKGKRAGSLRIGTVSDEASPLDVRIGSHKFIMGKDAAITIASSGKGQVSVEVAGGYVELVSGDPMSRGASIIFSTWSRGGSGLDPGDIAIIQVPPAIGFLRQAAPARSYRIIPETAAAFRIRAVKRTGTDTARREERARKAVAGWPAASRTVARMMIEKYGSPNSIENDVISWEGNEPWKKTSVYRAGKPSGMPPGRVNVLLQSVRYQVSPEAARAIENLGMNLSIDASQRLLSAAGESEDINFLALNLADEVATGAKTPQEAREFYVRTTALSLEGKSSPYLSGLLFEHF
ncbi:MAG: hypothetical protein HY078_00440 [Elusimicrobia bacterium]|nr:hypothetical protein [Elusimicrobiota bacterium]